MIDVLDYGAISDGVTDSTAAFQAALDEAAKINGTVTVPPGVYLCNQLKMHPRTAIVGSPSWSYRGEPGGSVINLLSGDNDCLLDITHAYGATIKGMYLDGSSLGENIHGICVNKSDYGVQEDTPQIEDCYIGSFSGDGVHLMRIWCFSIRHCMVGRNKGHGLFFAGWDGFILDCWFSGNKGYGIMAGTEVEENASNTLTGNRIEWNKGGIRIINGSKWNITGNYFDRASTSGIHIGGGWRRSDTMAITGNVIYRSGALVANWPEDMDEHENCHVFLDGCDNIVFTSNSMMLGQDDGNVGEFSPLYGMVLRDLKNCIVKDNVGMDSCLKKFLVDLGRHGGDIKIADNLGRGKEESRRGMFPLPPL